MRTALIGIFEIDLLMRFVISTENADFQIHLQSVIKDNGRFISTKNISISFLMRIAIGLFLG